MRSKNVTVIGAGAVGLSTAYYLRRHGLSVRVLDAGQVGAGCSAANAGWVSPSFSAPVPAPGATTLALRTSLKPTAPVAFAPRRIPMLTPWLAGFALSTRESRFTASRRALAQLNLRTLQLYDELATDGVSFEVTSRGIVCAYLDRELAARTHSAMSVLHELGLAGPDPLLDGPALRELEPALSHDVQAGYLCPDDRAINPATLTAGLAARLRSMDVEIEEQVRVNGFRGTADRVTAVVTSRGTRKVEQLVLTPGAGINALLHQLDARLPIEVVKGYSVTVQVPGGVGHAISCGDRKVACTPMDGLVRLAGILEFSGNNIAVDPQRVRGVLLAAQAYLTNMSLANPEDLSAVESLAIGQRTMTPDGLPVIDRVPTRHNVFVSGAHAMLGITTAPASGQALADFIVTGCRPHTLSSFGFRR